MGGDLESFFDSVDNEVGCRFAFTEEIADTDGVMLEVEICLEELEWSVARGESWWGASALGATPRVEAPLPLPLPPRPRKPPRYSVAAALAYSSLDQ